ncbi:MAG: hypothetical protein HPY85_06280 [Anaerolineae bacterium]|nr:hypothetical protein [Anaerolineae bacterium]
MEKLPQVYGHRGASEDAPENTILAFQTAIDQGADGIETDLRFTRDGVVVCFHDGDLQRMMGQPQAVSDLSYAELCHFAAETPAYRGEKVPTIDDLLTWRRVNCRLMLELKDIQFHEPAMMAKLHTALEAAGGMHGVWITSFDETSLRMAREVFPGVPLVWISKDLIPLDALWTDGYSPHFTVLETHPELSAVYHAAGKIISVWDPYPEERVAFHLGQATETVTPNSPRRYIEALQVHHKLR